MKKEQAHQYYLKRKSYNAAIVKEYLANGCAECGEMEPAELEFHHKDPSTKIRTIKSYLGRSTKLLEEELDKCVVLCRVCHYNVHWRDANQ